MVVQLLCGDGMPLSIKQDVLVEPLSRYRLGLFWELGVRYSLGIPFLRKDWLKIANSRFWHKSVFVFNYGS